MDAVAFTFSALFLSSCAYVRSVAGGVGAKRPHAGGDCPPARAPPPVSRGPLGVSIHFIRHFLESHPRIAADGMSTAEIKDAIVKPESAGSGAALLYKYVGVCDAAGNAFVGPASTFVSHAWSYAFATVVADALEQEALSSPGSFFWFDLFTNDQNELGDGKTKGSALLGDAFRAPILATGHVLLVLHPWQKPIPLQRAWCLFEIFTALSLGEGVRLRVVLPSADARGLEEGARKHFGSVVQALADMDAEKAQAKEAADRDMIFGAVRASVGFHALNAAVKGFLREWYLGELRSAASQPSAARDHELLAVVGMVLKDFGHVEEAIAYYEESLSLRIDELGDDATTHPSLSSTYNALGIAFDSLGDHAAAIRYFEKDLQITLAVFGPEHLNTAKSYNNLGLEHASLDDHAAAIGYFEKSLALKIAAAMGNASHPSLGNTYNNLGNSHAQRGDFDGALRNFEQATAILAAQHGDAHPSVAASTCNMAVMCKKKGDFVRALELYNTALRIRIETLGGAHEDVGASHRNMGLLFDELGDTLAAIKHLETALAIQTHALGSSHADTTGTQAHLDRVLRKQSGSGSNGEGATEAEEPDREER